MTLRTSRRGTTKDHRAIRADLDLRELPLPRAGRSQLDSGSADAMRAVREVFPTVLTLSKEKIELTRPTWTPDPRALFPAIQLLFDWLLDLRGERRIESPYR